jgi:phosphatidylglycerophosphate synthase
MDKNATYSWENETIEQTRDRIRRRWGDYPLTVLIINPINLRLVRKIARSSITPTQLTIIAFILTLMAALCISFNNHFIQILGGIFLLLGFLVDCLDGDLARLKGKSSPLGAMLDPTLDRFGEFAVILGMAINGWKTTGNPGWLISGIYLTGISLLYFYLVDAMVWKLPKKEKTAKSKGVKLNGTYVRFGAIEPFIWGQAILAFSGVSNWGLPIFSILFTIGCIKTLYNMVRRAYIIEEKESEHYGTHPR